MSKQQQNSQEMGKKTINGQIVETVRLARTVEMQQRVSSTVDCSKIVNQIKQGTWNLDQRNLRALQTYMWRTLNTLTWQSIWVWAPLCLWRLAMTSADYEAQETYAALWPPSVSVAVCAPLFFFLSQMAHVIPPTSCLVSFMMGYDEPSISAWVHSSHRGKRRKWGRKRGDHRWPISSRLLTFDWSQGGFVDSEVESVIFTVLDSETQICLRGLYNMWHPLSVPLHLIWMRKKTWHKSSRFLNVK